MLGHHPVAAAPISSRWWRYGRSVAASQSTTQSRATISPQNRHLAAVQGISTTSAIWIGGAVLSACSLGLVSSGGISAMPTGAIGSQVYTTQPAGIFSAISNVVGSSELVGISRATLAPISESTGVSVSAQESIGNAEALTRLAASVVNETLSASVGNSVAEATSAAVQESLSRAGVASTVASSGASVGASATVGGSEILTSAVVGSISQITSSGGWSAFVAGVGSSVGTCQVWAGGETTITIPIPCIAIRGSSSRVALGQAPDRYTTEPGGLRSFPSDGIDRAILGASPPRKV